jgi:hypothetical protein
MSSPFGVVVLGCSQDVSPSKYFKVATQTVRSDNETCTLERSIPCIVLGDISLVAISACGDARRNGPTPDATSKTRLIRCSDNTIDSLGVLFTL